VHIPDEESKANGQTVKDLMGNKPELRFKFIQENAAFRRLDRNFCWIFSLPFTLRQIRLCFAPMNTGQAVLWPEKSGCT
jgi:uncharacterized membrane protein